MMFILLLLVLGTLASTEKLNCASFSTTNVSSYNISSLSNIDPKVFTDCPKSLNSPGYTMDQLVAISVQAAGSLGNPCLWSNEQIQSLGIIIIGLNETFLNCIDINNASITAIGKSLYYIPSSEDKISQLYNRWKNMTLSNTLTSINIGMLQGLICGCTIGDIDSIDLDQYSKSINVVSMYNCFKSSIFTKLYDLTCTMYGDNANYWNVTVIKNIGSIVAGIPQSVLVEFSADKVSAIVPLVFVVLKPNILDAFSINQTLSLTMDQLKSIPQRVLANLTDDRRNLIISLMQSPKTHQSSTNKFTNPVTTKRNNQNQGTSTSNLETTTAADAKNPNMNLPNDKSNDNMETTTRQGHQNPNIITSNKNNSRLTSQDSFTRTFLNSQSTEKHQITQDQKSTQNNQITKNSQVTQKNQVTQNLQSTQDSQTTLNQLTTQATPDDEAPTSLPAVIDAHNIDYFIHNIASKLSTNDVRRIDPIALNNPEVLNTLSHNSIDISMFIALREKVEEMMTKVNDFNPYLYASGQNFISAKRYKELTNNQLELVIGQPCYEPNLNLLPTIGPKLADILLSDQTNLNKLKKSLINIPVTDFLSILNKQKINKEFVLIFNGSYLSERQSRDAYRSFLNDAEINFNNLDAQSTTKLLLDLPPPLAPSIRADHVTKLSDPNSSVALLHIIDRSSIGVRGLQNKNDLELGYDERPYPVEYELYEKMKNGTFSPLLGELTRLVSLLDNQLISVKAIRDLGTETCAVISSNGIYTGSNPTLVSSIFDICASILIDHCKSILTLPMGFMTQDELLTLDNTTMQKICLMEICPEVASISGSLMKIIVDVVEVLANNRSEILLHPRITSVLPHLKTSTLELMTDQSSIIHICKEMACEMQGNMAAFAIKEKMEFCLKHSISLRGLSCLGDDISLFYATVEDDFFKVRVSCDLVSADVDVLQSNVVDCKARKAVFACIKNMNFSDNNNLAQLGSLIDQMSDDEYDHIPKYYLCDLLPSMSNLYRQWAKISSLRSNSGFKPLDLCPKEVMYQRLSEVEHSPECTGVVSAIRRKRQSDTGVTCETIYKMADDVVILTANQLGSMPADEFMKCLYILGRIDGFNDDQWTALASLAKTAFNDEVSKWSRDDLHNLAGIISGLSSSEISSLVLNDIEAISAIGGFGDWDDDKLSSAFGSVKKNFLHDNMTSLRTPEFRSMKEIICGAIVGDISSIQVIVICESLQNIGHLETCTENQLAEFMKAIKDPLCIGGDSASWSPSIIYALANLIGGLTKDDLSKLSNTQIQFISPTSIPFIPAMQFNGFTANQLHQLSLDQAAMITSNQLKSLDAEKQQIIKDKLEPIKTEISLSLTLDNGMGKLIIGDVTMMMISLMIIKILIF